MKRTLVLVLGLSLLFWAATGLAQDDAEAPPPADSNDATGVKELKAELTAMREETNTKIEEVKKENEERVEKLKQEHEERLDDIETEMMENLDTGDTEDRFSIYGFFDLTFVKDFPDKNSVMTGLDPAKTSFLMSNLNIYFKSQMTDTLSALVELRFTFLPLGHETSLEMEGMTEYERVDTTVLQANPYKEQRLGGVAIERAHLTWQPADFFGVVAGYFLTPYGIWNIDHGTPTLIAVREPYMQWARIMPLTQLGLQLFGRAYPTSRLYFDYAFTVSNGRGPMDTVHDLDENKALGLRLRLSYEGKNVGAGLGGYGYYGKYTDIKKVITAIQPAFHVEQEVTAGYDELIGALDLLVEIYGVRLQGEFIRRLIQYSERAERSHLSGMGGYQPNYITIAFYGILAWELPLSKWLGDMKLTPYVEVDYNDRDDSIPDNDSIMILGGLNFKPSPFVTLKAEAGRVNSFHGTRANLTYLAAQMAVSF
ncbi:MAG: hypothetical protein GY854_18310 [Deltaproteobacteria bacterium]|nr:hypothetical protein [Deltaproteobacteria bacterium]